MNYQKDVSEFMILGEQKVSPVLNLKNDQTQLYMNLIEEEFNETLNAFIEDDLVEVADGLADMVWVIMGMCNSAGIDFDKIWKEVKSSNMSKFVEGKFIKNDAGKIMKPKSYLIFQLMFIKLLMIMKKEIKIFLKLIGRSFIQLVVLQ